ncbi:MAG TPA: thiol:disulfide interchange protein DsbA/DsbL [Casimicrobiaceae bacterium]|nr:thiol:disulfide interchange protein DsbA/DsbL [Casimicrobiaceae bacterium]
MRRFAQCLIGVAAVMWLAAAGAADLVEGRNYTRLKVPQPVESGNKIEVIEFFSYGCPHCADLEPYLQNWLKTLPADVAFHRVPVVFQERWKPLGKIYYTLDALGDAARLSPDVFQAIHVRGLPLWDDKAFYDWAASNGLDKTRVAATFTSFGVDSKIKRAIALAQTYNVQSVPTVVVDGKFITGSERVGGHPMMPAAIDQLIAKARAERAKS